MPMKFELDIGDIISTIMRYKAWQQAQQERERGLTQELVKSYGGLGGYAETAGEGPGIRAFEKMFGKKTPIPQQFGYETTEKPWPEGGGTTFEPQPRTRIMWPPKTVAQMLEQTQQTILGQPGVSEQVAKGQLGFGTAWEQTRAEATKRQHLATLAQSSITNRVNIKTPQGTIRPVTGPEAINYYNAVLSGETPDIELLPPTKESDKWEWMRTQSEELAKLGVYGKEFASLPKEYQTLINSLQPLGVVKVVDGIVQPPGVEVTGEPWKEVEEPLKGDMIQKWKEYTKGPKKGQREKVGVPYPRFKPEGGISSKDYAGYDFRIRDDARSMTTRELVARGIMKIVADPLTPGGVSVQFAVPAEQGDKLFRESYAKHYKDAVRGAKSQGYLPKEWKESPYGEAEQPVGRSPQDLFKGWQENMINKGVQPFTPKLESKILTKSEAEAILREAGGDKEKARKIARERGYKF